jgi:hypothetical protein
LPLKTALVILTIYSLIGTVVFSFIETEWGLFSTFYFVFITTSTVGFGDYFPSDPIVAIMSSVYFLFGLALCSMVLGLIQETVDSPMTSLTKKVAFVLGMGPASTSAEEEKKEEQHVKED